MTEVKQDETPGCASCPCYAPAAKKETYGHCRISPPVVIARNEKIWSGWPITNADDWCMSHPEMA